MSDPHGLGLSVDLDEWYHSRRWVDGRQAQEPTDSTALFQRLYGRDRPIGEVIAPTRALLDLFDRHHVRITFFILGEMAEWYPDLVREIADRGHEIASHGQQHVDITVLGPDRFARDLDHAIVRLEALTGQRPVGYRAPNLVYAPWATRILEERGFVYDATVAVSRPLGGKYRGWSHAPIHPYHPSYDDVARPGGARLVELPLPPFPGLRLAAGSGIVTRIFGFHWTAIALRHASRTGTTMFYFHPWEVGRRPDPTGHWLRNSIFLRHTGPWMMRAVERIIEQFDGRVLTARACANRFLAATAVSTPMPISEPAVASLAGYPDE
jgi:peptidoglycan/xylan/chitin deacetylase (PgdA/CDA1 family)